MHAGTLMPEMLQKRRNLPIHAKTTQAQSPVILMTLQMTLQESFEMRFVPEEEIQQVN